jgi:thiol-disulfide isomerase/thioredoxin
MKLRFLVPLSVFSSLLPLCAADQKAPPSSVTDFSSLKTPDEFWKRIEKLQQPPSEQPKSQEEAIAQVKSYLGTLQAAAAAFVKAFPADERSWKARMIGLRASMKQRQLFGEDATPDADQQKLNEILNAPEAPTSIKGEAAFMGLVMQAQRLDKDKPEGFAAFHKASADFLQKYSDHPLAGELKSIQMQVLDEDPTPQGTEMLKKFAAGDDARLAEAAKAILEKKQKLADLKSKPVDLKFTAADGQPVDLANLRGKVVLVDFWASWCGPCMMEMPNVVSTYGKLHEKGFEILGISLDQDKDAMEAALKKQSMTWMQYFDGGGWDNKIAKSFGIQSIPAAWLVDKKGMLRETNLRGEELGAAVEKLLAE